MFEFNFPRFRYEGCVYMHVWGREAERQAGEGGGEPGGYGIVYILLVRDLTNIHMVVHGGRERGHLV